MGTKTAMKVGTWARQAHVGLASLNQTVGDWEGNDARFARSSTRRSAAGPFALAARKCAFPAIVWAIDFSASARSNDHGTAWFASPTRPKGSPSRSACRSFSKGFCTTRWPWSPMAKSSDSSPRRIWRPATCNMRTDIFKRGRIGRLVEYRGPDSTTVPLGTQIFELPGLGTIGFEICEDAWKGMRPGSRLRSRGRRFCSTRRRRGSPSANIACGRRLVEQISLQDHCVYLYTSLLGCDATRLIFDGSIFIGVNGRIEAEGRRFLFTCDRELVDRVVDLEEIRVARMEEGSWREQLGNARLGRFGDGPA